MYYHPFWLLVFYMGSASPLQIKTLAGTGLATGSIGGTALTTSINNPTSVWVDTNSFVYVAERHANKVTFFQNGLSPVITIAGTGSATFNGDNIQATSASLNELHQIHGDALSNLLFIADFANHRIRTVNFATGNFW